MDILKEMDRFLENVNLPRLNQEEIEIMNNPVTSIEIETVIEKEEVTTDNAEIQRIIRDYYEHL